MAFLPLPRAIAARESVGRPAAGEVEDGTRGEGAVFAAQPSHERGSFLLFAKAVHRDLREHVVDVLLRELLENVGLNDGRRDAVHDDTSSGQFLAEGFR